MDVPASVAALPDEMAGAERIMFGGFELEMDALVEKLSKAGVAIPPAVEVFFAVGLQGEPLRKIRSKRPRRTSNSIVSTDEAAGELRQFVSVVPGGKKVFVVGFIDGVNTLQSAAVDFLGCTEMLQSSTGMTWRRVRCANGCRLA